MGKRHFASRHVYPVSVSPVAAMASPPRAGQPAHSPFLARPCQPRRAPGGPAARCAGPGRVAVGPSDEPMARRRPGSGNLKANCQWDGSCHSLRAARATGSAADGRARPQPRGGPLRTGTRLGSRRRPAPGASCPAPGVRRRHFFPLTVSLLGRRRRPRRRFSAAVASRQALPWRGRRRRAAPLGRCRTARRRVRREEGRESEGPQSAGGSGPRPATVTRSHWPAGAGAAGGRLQAWGPAWARSPGSRLQARVNTRRPTSSTQREHPSLPGPHANRSPRFAATVRGGAGVPAARRRCQAAPGLPRRGRARRPLDRRVPVWPVPGPQR